MKTKDMKTKNFEMFTRAGNTACQKFIDEFSQNSVIMTKSASKEDVLALVKKGVTKLSYVFAEVNDTEPEGHIANEVNKILKKNGYDFEINRFEF